MLATLTRALALGALLLAPAFASAAPADAQAPPPGYDFESGSDGFSAPGWLGANAGAPTQTDAQAAQGTHSLALPVRFTGGGYEQAGADKRLDDAPVDLSSAVAIHYDVYAPVSGLYSDVVFNDPWTPPADAALQPLAPGWNERTIDLEPGSAEFPSAAAYLPSAKELIVRVIGKNVTYSGSVYIDDVRFVAGTDPTVSILGPRDDSTVSAPEGTATAIRAHVSAAPGRSIASVRWCSDRQSGELRPDGNGDYSGSWDTWREGEGVHTLSVTATDSAGASTTRTRRFSCVTAGCRSRSTRRGSTTGCGDAPSWWRP